MIGWHLPALLILQSQTGPLAASDIKGWSSCDFSRNRYDGTSSLWCLALHRGKALCHTETVQHPLPLPLSLGKALVSPLLLRDVATEAQSTSLIKSQRRAKIQLILPLSFLHACCWSCPGRMQSPNPGRIGLPALGQGRTCRHGP